MEVDQVDVNRMWFPQVVDDVEVLNRADLRVIRGSHLEHVVSANHEPRIER